MTYQPSPDDFDEDTLRMLNQAVTDIRDVLEARGLFYEGLKTDEFIDSWHQSMVDLTEAGVTDREELCSRALSFVFQLKPPH